ncbi:hypothetical protein [Paenibacillus sp. OAS669]|uniref:hypothetical protein n=1 Tax=Paenibacillus sp. OAS669 TaxID=2663821 RepID=UPI0019EA99D6|nr:hypothetical protein [Paenibacillus sp. OAS669]MBE1445598.1 hypothetical protein [Paenibacillus sp. OAS669]
MFPSGDHKMLVELTVKEAWALSMGTHFWEQPGLAAAARKKVRETMEAHLFSEQTKVDYHLLEV